MVPAPSAASHSADLIAAFRDGQHSAIGWGSLVSLLMKITGGCHEERERYRCAFRAFKNGRRAAATFFHRRGIAERPLERRSPLTRNVAGSLPTHGQLATGISPRRDQTLAAKIRSSQLRRPTLMKVRYEFCYQEFALSVVCGNTR